ncbi:nucleoside recognition domain-containing protein, partial [Aquifex sp.]
AALAGEVSHFVIELPPYRIPSLKTVLNISWIHVKDFMYRAGTLIFAASILIWVLLNLPPGSSPKDSLAGKIGQTLVPVFKPMGIDDWQATTSLIPAFLAREIVLSSMGVIYSAEEHIQEKEEDSFSFLEALKEQGEAFLTAVKDSFTALFSLGLQAFEVEEEEGSLRHIIKQSFDKASALAFMIFILIYTSCLGTYATMGREVGYKLATIFLAYSFILAWLMGTITYNLFK